MSVYKVIEIIGTSSQSWEDAATSAVKTARETLREIQPYMCVQYIQAWRNDLERWGKLLETLPSAGSIEKALHELELPFTAQIS